MPNLTLCPLIRSYIQLNSLAIGFSNESCKDISFCVGRRYETGTALLDTNLNVTFLSPSFLSLSSVSVPATNSRARRPLSSDIISLTLDTYSTRPASLRLFEIVSTFFLTSGSFTALSMSSLLVEVYSSCLSISSPSASNKRLVALCIPNSFSNLSRRSSKLMCGCIV